MLDSYLVRVYRYNKHRPQDLIGTIQSAGQDNQQAFCSLEELWSVLCEQLCKGEAASRNKDPSDNHDTSSDSED